MLRYLFVLDVAFAVLGASMAIGVGVSALLLGLYLDTSPEQRPSFDNLLLLTLAFTVITLTSAASAFGLHRRAGWHWGAHALFALATVASVPLFIRILANQ
ncbi:MAG: hypothetical protein V4709_13380 [Pseudomonadota bacterium]